MNSSPECPASARARQALLDPIDVVTGECYFHRIDFALPGPIPFQWKAYYSNQLQTDGPLGQRWTFSYNLLLLFTQDSTHFVDGEGNITPFVGIPAVGQTFRTPDQRYALSRVAENEFKLVLPNHLMLTFAGGPSARRARLAAITDRNQRRVTFYYEPMGGFIRIVDSSHRILEASLDRHGRILEVQCYRDERPSDRVRLVSYQYDERGDLISVLDANGCKYAYQYDADHQLVKKTDRNAYSFHYRYENGRCIKTWGDDGLYTGEFRYEPAKRRTVFTGFDGRRLEYRYDQKLLVTEEVDPCGRVSSTQYDLAGNPVAVFDRCGRASLSQYDDCGNKIEEVDFQGRKTTYAYDQSNQWIQMVTPSGIMTARQYDDSGNLLREETGPQVTVNCYDSAGQRIFCHPAGQSPETYRYDNYHQLIETLDVFGAPSICYEYDLLGNVVQIRLGRSRLRYAYDRMSRLMEARYNDGTCEKNTYDPEGNVTSYTDRRGQTWRYRYKARKQLVEVVCPDGGLVRYNYSLADECFEVIDPNGNHTTYQRDLCDQIAEIHRNGVLVEAYERDGEGRVLKRKGPDGAVLADAEYGIGDQPLVRRLQRADRLMENTYAYDREGRLLKACSDTGEVQRAYDAAGRILSERMLEYEVSHTYDEQGRLSRTRFGQDAEFRLQYHGDSVTLRDPNGHWHAWHFAGGRLLRRNWAGGARDVFGYDAQGRLVSHGITSLAAGREAQRTWRFSFDALDRLARLEDERGEWLLDYDACERLTSLRSANTAALRAGSERFAFDPGGNVASVGLGSQVSVQAGNRLMAWADRQFAYDRRGRLVTETRPEGTFRYAYDSLDLAISVELPDRRRVTFDYDALRRRMAKEIGGERTLFGWDGNRLSWELAPNGSRRCYLYAGPNDYTPTMFCDVKPELDGKVVIESFAVHHDFARRPVLVTDAQGRAVWSAQYSAYGRATVDSRSRIAYHLRAPGQYFDEETGLHYNVHRYYDPETGRYTQPDPMGLAGGLNLYAWGNGNPLGSCDFLGWATT